MVFSVVYQIDAGFFCKAYWDYRVHFGDGGVFDVLAAYSEEIIRAGDIQSDFSRGPVSRAGGLTGSR